MIRSDVQKILNAQTLLCAAISLGDQVALAVGVEVVEVVGVVVTCMG